MQATCNVTTENLSFHNMQSICNLKTVKVRIPLVKSHFQCKDSIGRVLNFTSHQYSTNGSIWMQATCNSETANEGFAICEPYVQ